MISDDLVDKQAEMQVRSQEKKEKRSRKNASGPRAKKEPVVRGTHRSLANLLKDVIARPETNAKVAAWMAYAHWSLINKQAPPMWNQFFGRIDSQDEDVNKAAEVFKLPLPELTAPQPELI